MATKSELLKKIQKQETRIQAQKQELKKKNSELEDALEDVRELEDREIFSLPKHLDNIVNNSALEEFFKNIDNIDMDDFQVFVNDQTT